jgi:hypothetical protein
MKHRPRPPEQDDLLRPRLVDLIDMRHELAALAALLYLQHAFRLSDEAVVARWVETPYWQHFTREIARRENSPPDCFRVLLTPAPSAHRPELAGTLAQAHRRRGREPQ